jgi:hypothetical protein
VFTNSIQSSAKLDIDNKNVNLETFTRKGNDNYIQRYAEAAENYLNSLTQYLDSFPHTLTIVELPQNSQYRSCSYPGLIATEFDIISPIKSQKLEYRIASLLTEQYFGNIVVSNEFQNAWLSKGVSAFVAEKLVREHYGDLYSYFNFATYYPIRGLHFLSYSDIPIIYSIGKNKIPEGARFIDKYFKSSIYANMSIESLELPGLDEFEMASVIKPQIALLTLEKFIGSDMMMSNLSNYFKKYRYSHSTSDQFFEIIQNGCESKSSKFLNDLLKSGKRFDYEVKTIKKIANDDYEVLIVRNEDGIAPIKIAVYTEQDTAHYFWTGEESFKKFIINSKSEIISVEIDPSRENLLDLNYSNNSYMITNQYWGSLSFATRVFFWFQNAFLIFGGVG